MTFKELKELRYSYPSNIVGHLPFIESIASKCNHCTEFGFENGKSASALIAGCKGKVVSYDQHPLDYSLMGQEQENIGVFEVFSKRIGFPCEWEFIQKDTGNDDLNIEETDFLFIDSEHTADHVRKELRWHNRVSKYIGFHDTVTHGETSECGGGPNRGTIYPGILPALREFLAANPQWKITYQVDFNNGLTLIERQ